MNEQVTERHTMTLVETKENGGQLFRCPECGREFVLYHDPPGYEVLTAGNEAVNHSGSTGGVYAGVTVTDPGELPPKDAASAPEWLELDDG